MQTIKVKNIHGDYTNTPVARAAKNELKRPPFVLSAPTEKRVWSTQEIEKFYKINPLLNMEPEDELEVLGDMENDRQEENEIESE